MHIQNENCCVDARQEKRVQILGRQLHVQWVRN